MSPHLRISGLPSLGQCPGFSELRRGGDGGSAAAETGSAVGRLIELWHASGEHAAAFEEAARAVAAEAAQRWPRADLDAARTWALGYASDPRNRGVVVPGSCEREVRLELPPAPEDPTGQPVRLVGHLDQIRRDPLGRLRVWDTKSGRPGGVELVFAHAWQLAAYALAASVAYGEEVTPGGIIRLRAYTEGKPGAEARAHFEAPWSTAQCRTMLATAVQHVAWLRSGLVHLQPGAHCQWCPAGSPALCADRLAQLV